MKDDILEQLGKYQAPKKLPPIARRAVDQYFLNGKKLTPENLAALKKEIEALSADMKALTDTNIGLGAFAIYLRDTQNDPTTAEQVAQVIRDTAPKYQSIGERIVAAFQDLAGKATELLDRFSDREAPPKNVAPKFDDDEPAPAGTVPLKDLKPVGAPPPLRDRKKK